MLGVVALMFETFWINEELKIVPSLSAVSSSTALGFSASYRKKPYN